MNDLLLIPRRGAGRPMRVWVLRRPGPHVERIVRRLGRGGTSTATIASRLGLRPRYVAAVIEGSIGVGGPVPLGGAAWAVMVTAAAAEIV